LWELIRYLLMRDKEGTYLGILEITQRTGEIQRPIEQNTLLDG
jgi:DUF438 domain-containing protein